MLVGRERTAPEDQVCEQPAPEAAPPPPSPGRCFGGAAVGLAPGVPAACADLRAAPPPPLAQDGGTTAGAPVDEGARLMGETAPGRGCAVLVAAELAVAVSPAAERERRSCRNLVQLCCDDAESPDGVLSRVRRCWAGKGVDGRCLREQLALGGVCTAELLCRQLAALPAVKGVGAAAIAAAGEDPGLGLKPSLPTSLSEVDLGILGLEPSLPASLGEVGLGILDPASVASLLREGWRAVAGGDGSREPGTSGRGLQACVVEDRLAGGAEGVRWKVLSGPRPRADREPEGRGILVGASPPVPGPRLLGGPVGPWRCGLGILLPGPALDAEPQPGPTEGPAELRHSGQATAEQRP